MPEAAAAVLQIGLCCSQSLFCILCLRGPCLCILHSVTVVISSVGSSAHCMQDYMQVRSHMWFLDVCPAERGFT